MKIGKTVQRRIRRRSGGIDLVSDVNAAIAANVGESGSSVVSVSSRQATHREEERDGEEAGAH
jgi:hypothetical protein